MPAEASVPLIFLVSFLAGLSGALVPGPLLLVIVLQTARKGFWAAPSIVIGHAVVELMLVVALAAGLNWLLERNSIVAVISAPAGAVLVFMGWHMYKDAPRAALRLNDPLEWSEPSPIARGGLKLVTIGMIASLSNPFWLIWWAGIGSGFIVESLIAAAAAGVVAFYLGHIVADFLWYGAIGAAVAGGRRAVNARLYSALLRACAVFLLFMGAAFVYFGVQAVRQYGLF